MFRVLKFANEPNYEYYVDEEKGVVVCRMISAEKEARPFERKLQELCNETTNTNTFEMYVCRIFNKDKSFSGKAKCANGEEFNLSFGMQVAKRKCLKKYYRALTNRYVDYNNSLEKILDKVEDNLIVFAEKYQRFENNPYPEK